MKVKLNIIWSFPVALVPFRNALLMMVATLKPTTRSYGIICHWPGLLKDQHNLVEKQVSAKQIEAEIKELQSFFHKQMCFRYLSVCRKKNRATTATPTTLVKRGRGVEELKKGRGK